MGEARRRKLAGNTEPNHKYRKRKKITRKQERELTSEMVEELTAKYLGMGLSVR